MGNSLHCPACTTAMNNSVFTFSEDLVLKYTEGKHPKPLTDEELKKREDNSGDTEWMEKLRCIDDKHSKLYGLTGSQFNLLMERLELTFTENEILCPSPAVEHCYKHNETCTIKCADRSSDYIKCVDEENTKHLRNLYQEDEDDEF